MREYFPLMIDNKNTLPPILPIPWRLLNDETAKRNHDQTLEHLASRGGMSVDEIIANIRRIKLPYKAATAEDVNWLNDYIRANTQYVHVPQKPDANGKFQIRISEVIELNKRFQQINKIELKDIDWIDDSEKKIEIDQKILSDFKFCGLLNEDFIMAEFYKRGFETDSEK